MPHMMTTRKRQASRTDNEAVGAPKRPCYQPNRGRRQQSRDNNNNTKARSLVSRQQSRDNNNNKQTKSQSLVMNSGSPEPKDGSNNGTVCRYTVKNPEPQQPEQRLELSPFRTDQISEVVSKEEPNELHTQGPNPTQFLIIQTSPNKLFVFQQVANVVSDRPLVPLVQDQTNLRLQSFGIGIGRLFWNILKHNIASYIRGLEPN
ncbi:uncharacterized protein LOC108154908 [Drosophila miranda]|uniref:uncharacterized protein LOC108154908 n=1 Tax=Drosophila miranda TaxID=7229 RepID=UPI0007E884AC|nr:uncharacterized protein LOC108154908 [Drosophila miranda]